MGCGGALSSGGQLVAGDSQGNHTLLMAETVGMFFDSLRFLSERQCHASACILVCVIYIPFSIRLISRCKPNSVRSICYSPRSILTPAIERADVL